MSRRSGSDLLPTQGEINWCKRVVLGLGPKRRGALDSETARFYNRTLQEGDPEKCEPVIDACKRLLKQSPSPYREDRHRGSNHRFKTFAAMERHRRW